MSIISIYDESSYYSRAKKFVNMSASEIEAAEAAVSRRPASYEMNGSIAMIGLYGGLYKRPYFTDETGTYMLKNKINAAKNDKDVSGILLDVDSPGGEVDGIEETADAIRQAASVKPTVAIVRGMNASAAYWLTSQANAIYAVDNVSVVGSIGVRSVYYDYSEMYEKEGIKVIPVDTGEYKSAGLPGTKITENQIAETQKRINIIYDLFVNAVAVGRQIHVEQVMSLADGRIFMSNEAIQNRLIDGVLNFNQVFERLNQSISNAKNAKRFSAAQTRLKILDI